ncbi:unnamed protein product [Fusarium equiseti]|uniref:Uncharacterized protein n=1 Tax=Fusarium equiseti TaxID=61235 RepID=A0A8J2IHI3_FUSEQ|nr:unnamed protein product [Fusarium equiseti]
MAEWTDSQLNKPQCFTAVSITSAPPLATPPPFSPSSNNEPDDIGDYRKQLLNSRFASGKFACFSLFTQAHSVVGSEACAPFFYNKLRLNTPECEVYEMSRKHKLTQRPILGYFLASDVPCEKLYQRRLNELTPALWFEDPRKTTPEAFFVRLLVTNESGQTNAHVFRADILYTFVDALDNPTDAMVNLVWPALQHVQVPFAPQARFAERVAGQLLAGLKKNTPEEVPR